MSKKVNPRGKKSRSSRRGNIWKNRPIVEKKRKK